jgi:alanine dehydrogenase
MKSQVITKNDISGLITMKEVIAVLEQVFKEASEGKVQMPPKAYLTVSSGDFRAMPAAIPESAGIKWVNVHPENPLRNLPTVMAVLIYNDPITGYPLAVMDATDITAFRTGATSAIASKLLAKTSVTSLGIIGAGRQAYAHLQAHLELFTFTKIFISDKDQEAIIKFISYFKGYPVIPATVEEAAGADIVCTLTPSRTWYLNKDWLKPGTHVNAVGADAKGKEELDPDILITAKVVVDDVYQSAEGGEINVPVSRGVYKREDIYATLCDLAGGKPGRQNDDEITIFDSTGLAIEDLAVAKLIYNKAKYRDDILSVDLLG